jgi:erythromycin esterase-like protein
MRGELTIGQLVRERHPGACGLIGFTTYTGTVTAADDWGAPAERTWVRPALPDSVEELFHDTGEKNFTVAFDLAPKAADVLDAARLERAIGVPLERTAGWERGEVPETYPFAV